MGSNNSTLKPDDDPSKPKTVVKKELSKIYTYKLHTKKDLESLTGWERVKRVFETDMYGDRAEEFKQCHNVILFTFVVGCLIGGIGRSKIAYQNFFRANLHTAFETPSKAKAKLQEHVLIGFGSGAWRIGWRVAIFSTIYTFSSTCLSAYRGQYSLADPVLGGAVAGFFYKFRDGPKPTVAGAVLGGLLGLFGGSVTKISMALVGLTPDDLMAQNRQAQINAREKELKELRAARQPEMEGRITLEQLHSQILDESSNKPNEVSPLIIPNVT